ncbi:hypothetical protein PspLS_09312 [Pyricularia sp. CBS 133598]|nr:hypothetical protein PspLS_09312 [Pyricularia sp. CBS 133598]
MHSPSLFLILGFSLATGAIPGKKLDTVKSGSVHQSDSTRLRCGLVAFQPSGEVWMVDAKTEGWILPKGGYDSNKDGLDPDDDANMIRCVKREAKEEAGLYTLTSIHPLNLDGSSLHWYTAIVTETGPRTDEELNRQKRKKPTEFLVDEAWKNLSEGDQKKKEPMHRALAAALSYWESVRRGEC